MLKWTEPFFTRDFLDIFITYEVKHRDIINLTPIYEFLKKFFIIILSNISGREAVKIFQKFGYILDHQTGSHMILYHKSRPTLSVPEHIELAPGLL